MEIKITEGWALPITLRKAPFEITAQRRTEKSSKDDLVHPSPAVGPDTHTPIARDTLAVQRLVLRPAPSVPPGSSGEVQIPD